MFFLQKVKPGKSLSFIFLVKFTKDWKLSFGLVYPFNLSLYPFIPLSLPLTYVIFIKNKVAKQLYWNHTSAWVFSCKFAAYFQNTFTNEHLWTAASE